MKQSRIKEITNYKKAIALVVMAFFFYAQGISQGLKQRFIPTNSIGLINNADTSNIGFSGGFHAPSFANIDLDNDGVDELVAKDEFSDREWVFSFKSGKYQTATHLEEVLPPLQSFLICKDINNDGLKDIITGDKRVKLYLNQTTDSVRFSQKALILKYQDGTERTPIDFPSGEQPTLADVDNDGKTDILVFDSNGEWVIFYKNISQNDEFLFEKKTDKWGYFKEAGLNFEIILGANKRGHPGSKLLAFDYENDGDMDLLLSDITTPYAYFLENGKADLNLAHDSMISLSEEFPFSADFIDVPYFPSLSLVDVDFDGDDDLVCATSSRSPVLNGLVWYFENGNANGYDFTLKTKSFLQNESIDAGILASVATLDADADGDQDLIVSAVNNVSDDIFSDQIAYLQYYENIGTANAPLYTLKDNDYLSYKSKNYEGLRVCIGDIDNNGSDDLVLGTNDGEIAIRYNTAKAGEPFLFSKLEVKIEDLDVGSDAAPLIYDINTDGFNDLIIGELNGNLNLYLGSSDDGFSLKTENWGNVKTNTFYWQYERDVNGQIVDSTRQYISVGGSHPSIADVDADGFPDLITGSSWGKVYYYPSIDYNATTFKKAEFWFYNTHLERGLDKDLGEYCKPHLADLDNNGSYELLMGMYNGGIEVFTTDSVVVSTPEIYAPKNNLLSIFPNPSSGAINAINPSSSQALISVYTINGILVKRQNVSANASITFQLKSGIYLFTSKNKNHFKSQRVIVE